MSVELVSAEGRLGLRFSDDAKMKPFFVDFDSSEWRRRLARPLPKSHIFRKALGIKAGELLCDATAGFGQDALQASTFCERVIAIERSEILFAVLENALLRAKQVETLRAIVSRIKLIGGDALQVLPDLKPDVVYIDPMFNKPKSSAKSPIAMQLLQGLLGSAKNNESEILRVALRSARSRVVVKRPLKAPVGEPKPSHVFRGQSIRYDVFVCRNLD